MTAVSERLAQAKAEGRAALIGYLPVGYPSAPGSIEAMLAMIDGGVDMVEVGFPYTDPLMDGPVIQTATTAALERGVHLADVFEAVRAVTATGTPAVVMIYWNPVLRYGVDRFARELKAAGGSGLIVPDLVPDEAAEWFEASEKHGLDRVFLIAPSSTPERLAATTACSSGFVYTVAVMGVTGARSTLGDQAGELVKRAREVTDLPLCVGIGVSNGDQAAEVATFADGVIVGSALVKTLVDADGDEAKGVRDIKALATELAQGVRR